MEDLQSTLQRVLSDPEQMARVAALAESLGLKPPEEGPEGAAPGSAEDGPGALPPFPQEGGPDPGQLLSQLSALGGREERLLSALRPCLSPAGQGRVDRALRAAKLSRLAGRILTRRGDGHV